MNTDLKHSRDQMSSPTEQPAQASVEPTADIVSVIDKMEHSSETPSASLDDTAQREAGVGDILKSASADVAAGPQEDLELVSSKVRDQV